MTKEELSDLMTKYNKTQKDLSIDLGVNSGMINKAVKGGVITGWANAALTQYFAFLDVNKRLNVYPITKKS